MATRREYRLQTARLVSGKEVEYTAAAAGGTTSTATDLDLVTEYPNNSSLEGYTFYIPLAVLSADALRRVSSYVATTGVVTLAAPVLSGATITNSAVYELHGLIHPNLLHTYLNEALKAIPLVVDYNFAPTADTYDQDITTQQTTAYSRSWVRSVYKMATDTEQQQTITEAGSPSGGTFTVTYRGTTSGAIAYDASAATVQTALRLLPYLGSVTVTRTGTTTDFVWVVTMVGAGTLTEGGNLYQPIFTASAASLTGGSSPSITPEVTRLSSPLRELDGECIKMNGRIYLHLYEKCETTDRIYVKALKRAYDHCRTTATGVYGERVGLAAEAHEAEPMAELVAYKTLLIAAERSSPGAKAENYDNIVRNRNQWRRKYNQLLGEQFDLEVDAPLTFRESPLFGPVGGTFGEGSPLRTWGWW